MAYWDSKREKIVRRPDEPYPGYPGWVMHDCGCCAGIEWGGESPQECRRCNGGHIAVHVASGVRAKYPGGRFV